MLKLKVLSIILLAAMVLSACSAPAAPTATTAPEASEAPQAAAATEAPAANSQAGETPVKLGFVVHVTGAAIMSIIEQGAKDAAAQYGVELTYTGPAQTDSTAQIAMFDTLINSGVNGIVVIASDPSVWTEPIQRAVDKGIVVLVTDTDAPDSARTAFFGVDSEALGKMLGENVRSELEANGKLDAAKIVLGVCVIGPESHVLREKGFRSAFEGDNVTFVGPVETVCDTTQNYANWQNAYTANQDAAAFVGLTAVETPSLGKLKEEVGGDFLVASFDPDSEALRQMSNGNISVAVGQNVYLAGYLPTQALARHFKEGLEINPGVNLYNGELDLAADAQTLMDRESDAAARTAWYANYITENSLNNFGLVVK
ncbi:MAG TPA: substrate-binding domain-containing protein [Anaerolineaceae bacterium]|nr:substrate-binding domain-containing protein [Anaerolineaceae bacterium]